ncbi:MAG TPA: hypothetical protein VHW26_03780 [Solirubrobacteraceae bacterium]|nr:hypothetical protein [Solirubrobacteraceae bacterium]
MEDRPNTQHFTRRLTLPSGRRVEVVYFESDPANDHDDQELHRCGACQSELVQPVEWSPLGKSYWQVTLRCPNCEWSGTGVFPQAVLEHFDRELDRGTEFLIRELDQLELERMAEEVPGFVRALADDNILPSDF